ncbi:MAG: hypothetical protein IJ864_04165 [Alphaproteobacteria bacterium]|nr:hypothetical protein [Alphaproteobacteria bacterium]
MKRIIFLFFLLFMVVPVLAADTMVVFNLKTLIYHKATCIAARRCTKSCVKMPKEEAEKLGRACDICGG